MLEQQVEIEVVRKAFITAKGESPKVLVVGDLMLDQYIWGVAERISPEAPVPVVRQSGKSERSGGSANVAENLSGLGITTYLSGYIGFDPEGDRLMGMLKSSDINTDYLVRISDRPTITKTRVVVQHQQMLRLDQESVEKYSNEEREQLLGGILGLLEEQSFHAVILSDYAKGVLDEEICQTIIQTARQKNIFILVDPKGRDYEKYRGANTMTPNLREVADACSVSSYDTAAILVGADTLRQTGLGLYCRHSQ